MTEILKIVPYEVTIRQEGRDKKPLKDMLSFLKRKLETDPAFHAVFAYDKAENLTAYAFFTLSQYADDKNLDLYRIWHDSNHPNGLTNLVKTIKQIGKKYHLDSITATAQSREMVQIAKEWGFRTAGIIMERKFYDRRRTSPYAGVKNTVNR